MVKQSISFWNHQIVIRTYVKKANMERCWNNTVPYSRSSLPATYSEFFRFVFQNLLFVFIWSKHFLPQNWHTNQNSLAFLIKKNFDHIKTKRKLNKKCSWFDILVDAVSKFWIWNWKSDFRHFFKPIVQHKQSLGLLRL